MANPNITPAKIPESWLRPLIHVPISANCLPFSPRSAAILQVQNLEFAFKQNYDRHAGGPGTISLYTSSFSAARSCSFLSLRSVVLSDRPCKRDYHLGYVDMRGPLQVLTVHTSIKNSSHVGLHFLQDPQDPSGHHCTHYGPQAFHGPKDGIPATALISVRKRLLQNNIKPMRCI
jgi:hypothetical protein